MQTMAPVLKKMIVLSGLFVTGAVLGPLLIAALGALSPEKGKFGQSAEAAMLVDSYRDALPEQILWLTIPSPELEKKCGYETDSVFDGIRTGTQEDPMLDYAAYVTLNGWLDEREDEVWVSNVTEKIDAGFSDYHKSFLRRCIEATLFKSYCMSVVEDFGNKVGRLSKPENAKMQEDKIIQQIECNFVDGVAARKGIDLQTAHRSDSK